MFRYLSLFSLSLLLACGGSSKPKSDQKVLAQVGDQYLYLSDLQNLGKGHSPQDSVYYVKLYVHKWIEDKLLEQQARQRITNTESIDKMVKAYHNSILVNEYERQVLQEKIDSVVTPQQIADYYNQNKEQYQSGLDWVRCRFLKVPRSIEGTEPLRLAFKQGDEASLNQVKSFCVANKTKTIQILDENVWIRLDKLTAQLPNNLLSAQTFKVGNLLDRTDEDFLYLLKIYDFRGKNEATPLPQVQASIRNILLYQRQQEALLKLRKELYEEAKSKESFKIFVD